MTTMSRLLNLLSVKGVWQYCFAETWGVIEKSLASTIFFISQVSVFYGGALEAVAA